VAAGAWLRRHTRAITAGIALLVLALTAGAAVSWHFSSAVLVPDHSGWPADVEVVAVSASTVTLERTSDTDRPGLYGLEWSGGHAITGAVSRADADTVTRRLIKLDGYLVAGMEVGLDWNVYAGNPTSTLGLPFHSVRYRDQLGPMPAWEIPGRGKTWAIFVHGINSSMQTGLRVLPALHRADLPTLVISYREDLGAPQSPDGLHHMGLTEWRDLEAAARYAVTHGARRLVLVGYSMGGSLVTQFMQRSKLADRVAALVLDAPALDWRAILEFNSEQMGLPGFLALPVELAIGARIDADWSSLDASAHADAFHLPVLLFHGTEDDIVPIATSDEFAEQLPHWVTYYRVPKAGHTQSWNVNPALYDRRLERFLKKSVRSPRPSQAR
jgi:uncharacterized protein